MARGPILIELDDAEASTSVSDAPPVPDPDPASRQGQAMRSAAAMASRKTSRLSRWFWGLGAVLLGAVVSIAAWDFVAALLVRNSYLGWAVTGLLAAFLFVALIICLRELAAIGRLSAVDSLRQAAEQEIADGDLGEARRISARIVALYNGRDETRWGRERLAELTRDQMDAEALLAVTETELLVPLDDLASREVEKAARQVAAVTALVPLALADVAAALVANMRMIRRIAEIYGGRSGTLGSWRLTRSVFSHMVATGAVAVGDDLLEPVLGGSVLGKVSRRFGEGLVNGALTARVGVAAMEVCRPMPFGTGRRPRVRVLIKNALSGLVGPSKQG